MPRLSKALITIILFAISHISFASRPRDSNLRIFGDYMQTINPIIAAGLSSQEKGFGHFAFIYAQDFVTMHGIKFISDKTKMPFSKRPHIQDKRDRYDGMPSGHTNSAWIAASYLRTFSQDYKYLSIPLYLTASITGYSRIYSKEHTTTQVIAGAILAEMFTYFNSKMNWSNEYQYTSFYFSKEESFVSFEFRF